MDELILRLLPDNQEPQELVLQQHQLANSILHTTNAASSYVFNDYKYRAQLINADEGITNLVFLLNGKHIKINYSPDSGMIRFQDFSFSERIFLECYGFAQITIIFDDAQGNHQVKETEYINVMVRKGRQNDSIRRMTEYVYRQNSDLLNSKQTFPKDASGLKDSARKTIEAHILLLEQISVVYEENYRYFKMNSRFSTVPKERVDHFEKLQYISSNTLQYMVQHPEELQKSRHSLGIRIGNFRYLPNKTLITSNEKSYDIYENHVVLGFLMFLLREVSRIQQELFATLHRVPQKTMETDDYITSSYFIYAQTIESVKLLLQDVQKLQHKYNSLYSLYSEVLPITAKPFSHPPRFTSVFKSVPQYHQIYDCATAWFSKGVFTIHEEQFMLSFIKISVLYEIYVLTKIINYFQSTGYVLASAYKIPYPSPGKYYEPMDCNNCFVFQNDSGKVILYYQPVIYNTNKSSISGIGLYRNTSISYPKSGEGSNIGGGYYTPDFLIKYTYAGSTCEKYFIADAKFSRLQTIKNREVPELVYKYLFSISPVSEGDHVVGLCIFNGLSDLSTDSYTNIYDFMLSEQIIPRADIVTLTENAVNNLDLHEALLRNTVGLYVTETSQKSVSLPLNTELQIQEELSKQTISAQDLSKPLYESEFSQSASLSGGQPDTFQPVQDGFDPAAKTLIKKAFQKKEVDISKINLTELKLDKDTERRLITAGYVTVKDLLPNKLKSELIKNTILNRKSRREIEARLKHRKVFLE